jgi:RNA polymerase subunit RPABC4/transcription elongation factor Spt4
MLQENKCPNCHAPVKYGQHFCNLCGAPLSNTCSNCGTTLYPKTRICPTCGASTAKRNYPPPNPNSPSTGWDTPLPRWNTPQNPGWNYGQPPWGQPPRRSIFSMFPQFNISFTTRQLLFGLLAVLVICIGSIAIWQFGAKPDKTLPVISGVAVAFKGKTTAQIIWQTDKPCSSQVEYGRSTQYGSLEPIYPQSDPVTGAEGVNEHRVNLKSLRAGTTYQYRVKSRDAAGNEAVSRNFSFRTDEEAPFIVPE